MNAWREVERCPQREQLLFSGFILVTCPEGLNSCFCIGTCSRTLHSLGELLVLPYACHIPSAIFFYPPSCKGSHELEGSNLLHNWHHRKGLVACCLAHGVASGTPWI